MADNVSIATRPLVYSAFRYINNKVYTALAEYVDNALQSFLDHRELLSQRNHDGKLNVFIEFDFENDSITITDDAYGIEEENYQRAFELANIPLFAEGLSEFGMGMKVSSIWLSDEWSVITSAYGEKVRKTLVFNLKEVVDNEETELPVKVESAKENDHYTIISLTRLTHNKPSVRQLPNIKKHLSSIYTKFIREGTLNLVINGERMEYTELKCLEAPYYKNPNGKPILWKKTIDFEAPKPNGNGRYIAKGYIGLLETMSTSVDNGFLLFRRDRVIGSSYDEKYRPKELCGEVGSPRYKRIYGELYLEGFDVSFTKNSFQEDDDLESFIALLKDEIAGDKTFDLFGQAQYYTKPKSVQQKVEVGNALANKIAQDFSNQTSESSTPNNFAETSESQEPNETTPEQDSPNVQIKPIDTNVKFSDGKKFDITIKCEYGNKPYELYNLIESDGKYTSIINLKNPFFERYHDVLSKDEGINPIAYLIKTMIASEIRLMNNGDGTSGCAFRREFNKLFGIV